LDGLSPPGRKTLVPTLTRIVGVAKQKNVIGNKYQEKTIFRLISEDFLDFN
jgi:hypothetical protein